MSICCELQDINAINSRIPHLLSAKQRGTNDSQPQTPHHKFTLPIEKKNAPDAFTSLSHMLSKQCTTSLVAVENSRSGIFHIQRPSLRATLTQPTSTSPLIHQKQQRWQFDPLAHDRVVCRSSAAAMHDPADIIPSADDEDDDDEENPGRV